MIPVKPATVIAATILATVSYELLSRLLKSFMEIGYKEVKNGLSAVDEPKKDHKELETIKALEIFKKKTGRIKRIVAYIEFLGFFTVAFFLTRPGNTSALSHKNVISILAIVAGWMAIKIFGNYGQWSGPIAGRATYYLFLLGSFANIGIGLLFGYVIRALFV